MEFYSSIILSIIVIFILYKFSLYFNNYLIFRSKIRTLPYPKDYETIGQYLRFAKLHREDIYSHFGSYCQQFYKEGIVLTWLPRRPFVHIFKPEHMQKILSSKELIRKGHVYEQGELLMGQSIVTSKGEKWQKDRRLLNPSFHIKIITEDYSSEIFQKSIILTECIRERIKENPNGPINIYLDVKRAALDVICQAAMGVNKNIMELKESTCANAINKALELIVDRNARPWLDSDFLFYNFTKHGRDLMKNINVIHEFARELIENRRAIRKKNGLRAKDSLNLNNNADEPRRKIFLDLLLDTLEEGRIPISYEEIVHHVTSIMLGGYDTSSAAVSYTLFLLGNHLDIQEKVHEEIKQVFGDSNEPLTVHNIKKLEYFDRVIKESLRYYTPIPWVLRHLDKDLLIDDSYLIPKDSTIIIQLLWLHRNPEVWDNPEKFDPDRFLPENSKGRHPYSFIPFSAGPRNCIGQKFAIIALKALVLSVLRNWRVKSVKTVEETKLIGFITLEPNNCRLDLIMTSKD